MPARFDIEAITRDPQLVAVLARADEVFSLLSRGLTVPPNWAALVWGASSQPQLILAGRQVEASLAEELLLIRTLPIPLAYQFGQLFSSDGYEFTASVRLSVQVVAEKTELTAFRRALLGLDSQVRVSDLQEYLDETVRAALTKFTRGREAQALASAASWEEFDGLLAEQFKPLGFACGLSLCGGVGVTMESPAYARSRQADQIAALQHKRLEADERLRSTAAAARSKHLAELGALLEEVKAVAAKSGGLNVADLVKTFDARQRGALYEGLVALNQLVRHTEAVLVLAGSEIIWLDPADPRQPVRRRELESGIGPLRSIRLARDGEKVLFLIGAKRGVHLVEPEAGATTYALAEQLQPRGGVNAAVLFGDHLYATHSEVGVIRWPKSRPNEYELVLPEVTHTAHAIRDIQADESGRLLFTVNHMVIGWRPDKDAAPAVLSGPAEIATMLYADGFIFAGLNSGAIVRWDLANPAVLETLRPPGDEAVRSLDWLGGGGIPRLLIADGRPHLDLQVLGDGYRAEYRCDKRLRWGFAADDYIVGVNDSRDQLVIWRIDAPAEPAGAVSIGRLCGRSIHDVALLPAKPPAA